MSSVMNSPTASRSHAASSSTTLSLKASTISSHRRPSSRPETLIKSYSETSSPTMASQPTDPATELFQQKLRERKEELQRQGRLGEDSEHSDRNTEGISTRYATKTGRRTPSSGRIRRSSGQTMGLREQEEHISKLDKQNFDLKLRIYHQDKRLDELLVELEQRDAQEKEMRQLINEQQRELERRDQSLRQAVDTILLMDDHIRRLKNMLQDQKDDVGFLEDISELTLPQKAIENGTFLPEKLKDCAQEFSENADVANLNTRPAAEVLAAGRASAEPFIRTTSALSRYTDDSLFAIDRLTMKSPAFSVLSEGDLESVYAWKEERLRGGHEVDTRSEADLYEVERMEAEDKKARLATLKSDTVDGVPDSSSYPVQGQIVSDDTMFFNTHEDSVLNSYPPSDSAILNSDNDSDTEHESPARAGASANQSNREETSSSHENGPQSNTESQHTIPPMPPRRPAQETTPPRRVRPLPPLPREEIITASTEKSVSAASARRLMERGASLSPTSVTSKIGGLSIDNGAAEPFTSRPLVELPPEGAPQLRRKMDDGQAGVNEGESFGQLSDSVPLDERTSRSARRLPPSSWRPRPSSLTAKEEHLLKYIEGIDSEFYIRGPREMMLAAGMFAPAYASTGADMPPTPPDTVAAGSSAAGSRQNIASETSTGGVGEVMRAADHGSGLAAAARAKRLLPTRVTFGPTEILKAPADGPASSAAAPIVAPSRRRISFLRGRRMSWARGGGKGTSEKGAGCGRRGSTSVTREGVAAPTTGGTDTTVPPKGESGDDAAQSNRNWRDSTSSDGGEKDAVAGPPRRRWSFKAHMGGGKR